MKELYFGTAGVPICLKERSTVLGIEKVNELGLGCMEVEFVRGVNMKPEMAAEVKKAAQKFDVKLSAHGPYYINLNSPEKEKVGASRTRIYQTAKIAYLCGASTITFHAAYYMKTSREKVYDVVKAQLKKIISQLKDEGISIWVRPETTGKETQFGTVQELVRLSQELDMVMPCVDFAHLHARSVGKFNTYDEFAGVLNELEKGLGRNALDNMHIHISGINYGEKGEKNHLILEESDFNYAELMRAFKDFRIKGIVICESPNIEQDAMLMQKTYKEMV
ncbi:hypothetical protein D6745_03340 [Candidatus Woesearchaeota archaeon]|nr:MAG: hypothetical protein D6745_03340 [Candidatus Woesearchaeota archaeon]